MKLEYYAVILEHELPRKFRTRHYWNILHPNHVFQFEPMPFEDKVDLQTWCVQTFGPAGRTLYSNDRVRWIDHIIDDAVRFRDEADAMLFRLKWE